MKFRQLKYFVSLAQTGIFSEAADQVHVSQPALSQQIQKLEDNLETTLFERMSSGVKLTPAGEEFFPYAIDTLDSLRDARESIKHPDGEKLNGTLRMGIIPTIAPYLLPDMINFFHRRHPELTLYIEEQQTETLLDRLKMGEVDHLILSPPIPKQGFETETIGTEPFYLAVGNQEDMAGRTSVSIEEIDREPMLLLEEGHCLRDQSVSFCERENVQPDVVFQGSNLQSILNLVETGFGMTFVPRMVLHGYDSEQLRFVPFTDPVPERDLILVRRSSFNDRLIQKRLIEFTSDWFANQEA
ncbi:MAG: LysR substrate-binding domain-containing protein [bacterium]